MSFPESLDLARTDQPPLDPMLLEQRREPFGPR